MGYLPHSPGFTPTTNAPALSHTEVETQVLVLVCRSLTHSEPAPITLSVHLCKKPSRLARLPPRGAGSESHSPYQAAKIRTATGPCKRVARWSRTVRIRCSNYNSPHQRQFQDRQHLSTADKPCLQLWQTRFVCILMNLGSARVCIFEKVCQVRV